MTLLYRVLGLIARWNQRLSRMRVNFMPLNLGLIVGLGILFFFAVVQARDAVVNGAAPHSISIADALAHRDMDHNWVAIKGELHPEFGFKDIFKRTDGSEEVKAAYIPLLDAASNRALLVKRDDNDFGSKPGDATITGMLVPISLDVEKHLKEQGGKIDDVPLDTEYVLEEGRRPGSAGVWVLVTLLSAGALGAFAVTALMKYVVFQPTGRPTTGPMTAAPPPASIDLRVTGRMVLDAQNARRFLNVPCIVTNTPAGETALVSNIDASSRMYGITYAKREGLWGIVLPPGSVRRVEYGNLYDGSNPRPTVRLHYQAGPNNDMVLLSFANAEQRDWAINDLNHRIGFPPAS